MTRSTNKQHRQAQWRERLERQAQSGQSVKAFCQSEGVAVPSFYWWRKHLAQNQSASTAAMATGVQRQHDATPFIDLGTLGAAASAATFDIRLALPGGITLTITAR
jgi:transposase-like protein